MEKFIKVYKIVCFLSKWNCLFTVKSCCFLICQYFSIPHNKQVAVFPNTLDIYSFPLQLTPSLFKDVSSYMKTIQAPFWESVQQRTGQTKCILSIWASLVAQRLKRLPPMQETWVRSLGWEDPLGKEMVTHSSILAWMEKPGRLQSMGLQRVGHDLATSLSLSPHLQLYLSCRYMNLSSLCYSHEYFNYFIFFGNIRTTNTLEFKKKKKQSFYLRHYLMILIF